MQITVEIPDEDVEFIDLLTRHTGAVSRDVTLRKAVGLLQNEVGMNGLQFVRGTAYLGVAEGADWAGWFAKQG